MPNNLENKLWLIGAGYMAIEYAKVLSAMNINFHTIGRGEISAKRFTNKTSCNIEIGGLNNYLKTKPQKPIPNPLNLFSPTKKKYILNFLIFTNIQQ